MADTLYGKCVCVVHYFTHMYTSSLMPCMFLLLHMRVPFKLWLICTV